jgi:phospholipid/cholesterol/gamma-HCH transport system substrate-binding protein
LPTPSTNTPSDQEIKQAIPQQKRGREARVGLFVLLGGIAFLATLYMLTDPATFRGRYMVTTSVENAMGLRNGDPVQMRGVNIGRVNRFDLTQSTSDVLLVLEIEGEWAIPEGSRTRLVSTGLLGGRTVEVIPGTGPRIAPLAHLPGSVVKGLLDDTESLGEKGELVLDRVGALLSDSTITALGASIQDLQALLSELSDVTRSESGTIKDMIASLNRAAEGLESMTAAGPETGAELASAVTYADSLLQHMNQASVRLDQAAGSLEVIMARMERGEGTLGQLSTNDSLYHTLTATVESVRLLMVDLRENPGRYINLSIF